MKRDVRVAFIILFLFITAGMVSARLLIIPLPAQAAEASSPQSNVPAKAVSKEACLDCHGPFDKLVGNVNYQAPSGEKITPHRYVPHNAKEAKGIPECSNCHEPHPVPPTQSGMAAVAKPDAQWCYTTCHHKNNFQLCKDCHK